MERLHRMHGLELTAIIALMGGSLGATWYFHFVRGDDALFSHLFYLPIVLAGLRWGMKALSVPLILTANLIVSHYVSEMEMPVIHDLLRGSVFLIVGAVLGFAVDRSRRLQMEAVRQHRENFKQMSEHFEYVERVAHELRNPLQVSLSVLDSLDMQAMPRQQKTLLDMLNRSTDEINVRIRSLTSNGRN